MRFVPQHILRGLVHHPGSGQRVRRAILDPDAEIVAGYPEGVMAGAMPGKRLSEVEVEALVRYLGSLSK